MLTSLLCRYCERRWPARDDDYRECPLCREPTRPVNRPPSMTLPEAQAEKQEYDFGWWLWDTGRM
jgi:hypothetical protein